MSLMMEKIELVNQIFGTTHGKTCVIAKWEAHHISKLTPTEREELLQTCKDELKETDDKLVILRCHKTIRNIEESYDS